MKHLIWLGLLLAWLPVVGQRHKPAYQWFDGQGRRVDFGRVLKACLNHEVILFGELHNNAIAHWMQYELAAEGRSRRPGLILAGEMFETHQQSWLNRYLAQQIDEKTLLDSAGLWPNYATDYAPVVNLARDWGLPVVATNIPRRYARQVFRQGLESLGTLSPEELALMTPLPFPIDTTLPSYRRMVEMMGGHGGAAANFVAAQAIKDATMAHFILRALRPGTWLLHLNGSYHSDDREGIAWYLLQARPSLRLLTLTTVEQADVSKLEARFRGKADFVLVVPQTMTKTH
jgi:uncharacterized iron-regulated protein